MEMYPIQTVGQLGPYLKALRQARGWTQAALADALGVSRARVNVIERDPGAVSVARLLDVLAVLGARLGVEATGTLGQATTSGVSRRPAATADTRTKAVPARTRRENPQAGARMRTGIVSGRDAVPPATSPDPALPTGEW